LEWEEEEEEGDHYILLTTFIHLFLCSSSVVSFPLSVCLLRGVDVCVFFEFVKGLDSTPLHLFQLSVLC